VFYVSEVKSGGTFSMMLCVLRFGISIMNGKASTAFHLLLH